MHYQRWRVTGSHDLPPAISDFDRFFSRVEFADCWRWTAGGRRYGRHHAPDGRLVLAHRHCYELLVGPIPAGLVLDHLCMNTQCVNPDHLEPVTQAVNVKRAADLRRKGRAHV